MITRTNAENTLIDDFMNPAYNDARKGSSILRMMMEKYDFDMALPQEYSLLDIENQWNMIGQVLFSVLDYFDSISDKLGEILFENSEIVVKNEK